MAKSRQRIFQQTGQVDTQWEMRGSPSALPSSEVTAEYDTTDSTIDDPASQGFGGSWAEGQKNAAHEAVWQQVDDPDTREDHIASSRYDQEVTRAYQDNWDDLAGA
jgi:hypothetical protein